MFTGSSWLVLTQIFLQKIHILNKKKKKQYYGIIRVLFFKLCTVSAIKFHPWKPFLLCETNGFIKPRFVVSLISHYEVLRVKCQYTVMLIVSYHFPLKTEIYGIRL